MSVLVQQASKPPSKGATHRACLGWQVPAWRIQATGMQNCWSVREGICDTVKYLCRLLVSAAVVLILTSCFRCGALPPQRPQQAVRPIPLANLSGSLSSYRITVYLCYYIPLRAALFTKFQPAPPLWGGAARCGCRQRSCWSTDLAELRR